MASIINAAEITRLRTMEKAADPKWRHRLLSKVGPGDRNRIKLIELDTGPTRGSLHVYARRGEHDNDYSAGLVLYDLDDDPLVLLRLNGPHIGAHVNKWPAGTRLPVRPHAHYLTERYLTAHHKTGRPPGPDGYALMTTAYRDVEGAVEALARRTNILPGGGDQLSIGNWPYVRTLPA